MAQANLLQSCDGESRTSLKSISVQRHSAAKYRNPQGGNFSGDTMSNRVSTKRTPGPTSRMPSMPSSNKKKPRRSFGRANAIRASKNFQEGEPLRSGTAVASGSASSPAKAVQSVIPKSAKGIHAELGSQGVSPRTVVGYNF